MFKKLLTIITTGLFLAIFGLTACQKQQAPANNQVTANTQTQSKEKKESSKAPTDGKHKLVIHVSSGNKKIQDIALNNAFNVLKHYGKDKVKIEIVAYGPGLKIFTKKSDQKDRIELLSQKNVHLSACGNTITNVTKKTGKKPQLLKLDNLKVVPAGVVRIMELQEQGYTYLRP